MVQLGLIQTDVAQSQPGGYSERGEEGGYETSANGLSHGELFSFREVLVGSICTIRGYLGEGMS